MDRPSSPAVDDRPRLAMICNTLTPYRIHLHSLLARGIPELKLLTLVTHGAADFDWQMTTTPEIHVTNFSRGKEPAHGGLLVAPWTDWNKGADLIRFCDSERVAAAILTGYGYPSHLRLLRHLARRRIPFFLRSDSNIHIEELRSAARRAIKSLFFQWASRRAAGAMPMGEFGIEYFAKYGFARQRMYRVPYTPDYDWFAIRDDDAIQSMCQQFQFGQGRRRLLYSGRLHPVKRVDLLLDAFARIAADRPNWDLVIVGAGPLEELLRAHVPANLRTRVHWTAFLEAEQLRAAYHACDALVLPSLREPWGVVVQEAMAAGIPVIASDVVGAARDLVEDRVSGRIFRNGDLGDLTTALLEVTDELRIAAFQAAAPVRLACWRQEVDVVAEVRRALGDAKLLPSVRRSDRWAPG